MHSIGCSGRKGLTFLYPSFHTLSTTAESRVWPSSVLKTKGGAGSPKSHLRLISTTVAKTIISLSPGGAAMEVDDPAEVGVVDLKTKLPLPEVFLEFLKQNGVDPAIYDAAQNLPRYIRLKPGASSEISEIEEQLGVKLLPLSWLPGFFSLPCDVQIAGTKAYQEGKIYGMDAASVAAVAALEITPGDHVLDLCSAPGLPSTGLVHQGVSAAGPLRFSVMD